MSIFRARMAACMVLICTFEMLNPPNVILMIYEKHINVNDYKYHYGAYTLKSDLSIQTYRKAFCKEASNNRIPISTLNRNIILMAGNAI